MGYVVGAAELIPTLKSAAKNTYTTALIPQWPHFYTWLLQAAGYLLLNNKKQKLCIISQQSHEKNRIILDMHKYPQMMGKIRKISSTKAKAIKTSMWAIYSTEEHSQISDNLMLQLPFIRTIQEVKELVHLSLGEKISSLQTKKCIHRITNHREEYNIVFLANMEFSWISRISKKINEEKEIVKSIQSWSSSSLLIQIFQSLLSKQKKQPEMIAYVKPQHREKSSDITTRYICAVG